ncbi:MAG: DUF3038 domain-containing protein [Cyanobacteria bacterium P01_F01_bin.53]
MAPLLWMSLVPADNLPTNLSPEQLSSIKAQLDLVLMAIEALTDLGSDAVLSAAKELQLNDALSDRVGLWRLRQSSPLRKGKGRKKLDIEEARALVLVVCHLAQSYHGQIREAVAKLEALTAQNEPPHRAALLGDYLDNFNNMYYDRMAEPVPETAALTQLSLRLLIDLLFYSAPGGARQLWLALLDRTQLGRVQLETAPAPGSP